MDLEDKYIPPVKLKKTTDEDNQNDVYCFECHHEGDVINCDSCPRVYHLKCLGLTSLPERNWTCPECEATQSSFNIINQSTPLQRHSVNELHSMLKHAFHRLKSHPQAEYFLKTIDIKQTCDYFDYIIHPMDLEIIEKNLNLKKYSSTEAFISDMKWILHNSFIYNGNHSKLTHIARSLFKTARHEMTEIEICPECYLRSAQPITTDWFTKPCAIPHTLCWAKMKRYQSWPAKVLRIVNDEVDVRFFGQHDRAWVSLDNCFVLSKEYPGTEKKKLKIKFEKSLAELQIHIEQLKKLYGHFTYAPSQTLLNKTKPFKFISIIDDSILPSYITAANNSYTIKHSKQRRCSISELNIKKTNKRSNENSYEQSTKRIRSDENLFLTENNELQSTLNVFDIFNQPEQILSNDNEIQTNSSIVRSSSPTDNKLRIQALLRKYTISQLPTIESIHPDVRSSMNALLDAIEALKTISEVHTDISNQIPEQRTRTKKPRKSTLQHRIVQKNTNSNFVTCPSLDQFLSPSLPFVPLRPLSVSPPSVDIFESIPSEINDNITIELSVKSEEGEEEEEEQPLTQSSISTSSFLTSPSLDTNSSLPTTIPNSHSIPQIPTTISQQNNWPSILSINPPRKQSKNKNHRRLKSSLQNRSNNRRQSRIVSETPSRSNQNSTRISNRTNEVLLNDHQTRNEIQVTIDNFNDQFQHLLGDLTSQIDSSLRTTRIKYEKDLEEIRRSYRLSLNELHSITTEQVQDIHNSLELQYWKRLSEMRNRYESKLHYSLPFN